MFADVRGAAALHGKYTGRFLTGRYDLMASGVKGVVFEPSSIEEHRDGGLMDKSVLRDLETADRARQSVVEDIQAGFGRVNILTGSA